MAMIKTTKTIVLLVLLAIFGLLATLLFLSRVSGANSNVTRNSEDGSYIYSAFDSASWAITSGILSPILGIDKQYIYDDYILQCNDAISNKNGKGITTPRDICNTNDKYRMRMNRDQPKSMYNYTKNGYAKTRVPPELFDSIKDFFEKNRHRAEIEWKEYNVYHNAWETPPTIVHLNQAKTLQNQIVEIVQPILEQWVGQHLSLVSSYGIRLYHNGSILAPHVDRMPLVTSVISK